MSQIAVITVKVVADGPSPCQGDSDAKPSPEPSASNKSEVAAAIAAPATIAGHEIADTGDSSALEELAALKSVAIVLIGPQRQKMARSRIMGRGTPSSQSRIPRPMMNTSKEI
jgi:hypothetical protein